MLSSLVSLTAWAAPQPGVDCACNEVGAYVLPDPAVAAAPPNGITGLSAGGKYKVTAVATPGFPQPSEVTVTRVSDMVVVLAGTAAASWGFSPDEHRFIVATRSFGGAPALTSLHDLTAVPATLLKTFQPSPLGSAISFSPNGVYVLDLELIGSANHAELRVLDAATGDPVLYDTFNFTSPMGMPGSQLGAAALGFGPDAADRTLTWAYLTGATSSEWVAVNLATGMRVASQSLGGSFQWGFSPCGDAIGVVNDDTVSALKYAVVRSTLAASLVGSGGPFPATDTTSLSVTAAQHQVVHNVTTVPLGGNTAAATCPAPPANNPPVAAFPLPPMPRLSKLPLQLSDQSTDSDGRVVAWSWDFGDTVTSTLRSPSHVYSAGGTYTVSLTVTDDRGGTGAVSHPVSVAANAAPAAAFTFTPALPARRSIVTFTDTSTDDDGVVSRQWTIDGTPYSTPTVMVRACPPSVVVSLQVSDHAGQSSTRSLDVSVDGGSTAVAVPAGADLAAAIAGACPGDELQLEPGHYQGGVSLPAQVSLKGAGMGATFIDGWGSGPSHWVLQAGVDLSISDLTLSDGGVSGSVSSQNEAGGGLHVVGGPSGAAATRVTRVEVASNLGSGGIWLEDNYGNPAEFSGLKVHHNRRTFSSQGGSGIDLFCCSAVTVEGSEFTANSSGEGPVFLWEAEQVLFKGNHVHGNQGTGLVAQRVVGSGPGAEVSLNRITGNDAGVKLDGKFVFAGNLVAGNSGVGLVSRSPITIVNATIADNADEALDAPAAVIWNTLITGNAYDEGGAPDAGGSNIMGGPAGFVDAGDYHLGPGSPAIDRGDDSAVPAFLLTDGDGDRRVLGPRVDIGWDEVAGLAPGDAGPPDAGTMVMADAGLPDAGLDAGTDAGIVDSGVPDAGLPDAGPGVEPTPMGCGGCSTGTPEAALLLACWVLSRRRRAPRPPTTHP
ncbi:MAG: PKD domain-containing protein [Archangiaceae bacterium]|nr:PKD domain-containing protein [Archangiaceae bacterium]